MKLTRIIRKQSRKYGSCPRTLVGILFSVSTFLTTTPTFSQEGMTQNQDVCVAYFTWWQNTTVPAQYSASADPDSVSGASLQNPGHVGRMAQRIAEKLNTTAFPIRALKPYPYHFNSLLPIVREENSTNARPPLNHSTSEYRIGTCRNLYLGFPNWDYDMPAAVKTFVESIDRNSWTGVTIYPFSSTGTGGWGNSLETLRTLVPNVRLAEPLAISRRAMKQSDQLVDAWLAKTKEY